MTQTPDPAEIVSYGKRITDLAVRNPDATAMVFAATDGTDLEISWRELDARSSQVARLLASRGAGLGDLVACGLPNSPEHFYVTIGAWIVGDEPAGIGLREDESPITRNTSRFVPHYFT